MPYGEISDDIKAMDRGRLEDYVGALEYLDESRERLLAALPDCPDHGTGCVPYAVAWIEKAKALGVTLGAEEMPGLTYAQKVAVSEAIAKVASR